MIVTSKFLLRFYQLKLARRKWTSPSSSAPGQLHVLTFAVQVIISFVLVQAEEHLLQLRRRSRVGAVQASQGPQAHRDGQDGVPQPEHEQLLVSFSRPEYNIMYRCLKSKLEILFQLPVFDQQHKHALPVFQSRKNICRPARGLGSVNSVCTVYSIITSQSYRSYNLLGI